jgi:hypothetical protein
VRHVSSSTSSKFRLNKSTCWNKDITLNYRHVSDVPYILRFAIFKFPTPTLSSPRQQIGVSGQCHTPATLYPWERTSTTHWIGGWVGLRPDLDTETKGKTLCLCCGSTSTRLTCSQALYWLSYPNSYVFSSFLFQNYHLYHLY